jgi:NADP-dependent 3-hydroxy acid dehydrogenase YdfG
VGFASDVSDEKGCLKVAEFMQSKENKIDILVNNAGTNW